jgi:hypothetical protein
VTRAVNVAATFRNDEGALLSFVTPADVFHTATWTLVAALAIGTLAALVMAYAGAVKFLHRRGARVAGERGRLVPANDTGHAARASLSFDREETANAAHPADKGALQGELDLAADDRSGLARQRRPWVDAAEASLLTSRLAAFAGATVDVCTGLDDAIPLADELSSALKSARWTVRLRKADGFQDQSGIRVQTGRGTGHTVQKPAVALMLALQELGFGARADEPFDPNSPERGGDGAHDSAAIRLIIGTAPWQRIRADR